MKFLYTISLFLFAPSIFAFPIKAKHISENKAAEILRSKDFTKKIVHADPQKILKQIHQLPDEEYQWIASITTHRFILFTNKRILEITIPAIQHDDLVIDAVSDDLETFSYQGKIYKNKKILSINNAQNIPVDYKTLSLSKSGNLALMQDEASQNFAYNLEKNEIMNLKTKPGFLEKPLIFGVSDYGCTVYGYLERENGEKYGCSWNSEGEINFLDQSSTTQSTPSSANTKHIAGNIFLVTEAGQPANAVVWSNKDIEFLPVYDNGHYEPLFINESATTAISIHGNEKDDKASFTYWTKTNDVWNTCKFENGASILGISKDGSVAYGSFNDTAAFWELVDNRYRRILISDLLNKKESEKCIFYEILNICADNKKFIIKGKYESEPATFMVDWVR